MPDEISTLLKRIGIFLFLVIIFLWIYQDPQRDESGSIVEAGNIDALELFAGDCYKDSTFALAEGESKPIYTVEAVPCSSPHNNEIANTFPNLASKKINIDIFEQMGDICFTALSIYTNDSENTSQEAYDSFNSEYRLNILYFPLTDLEIEADPNKKFSCVISNNDSLSQNSVRNYFSR
jgi:hypothetical protein